MAGTVAARAGRAADGEQATRREANEVAPHNASLDQDGLHGGYLQPARQYRRSWRLDHSRSLNEVRHIAEYSQHFDALTGIRFGPAGVGYEVAHAHKRASD